MSSQSGRALEALRRTAQSLHQHQPWRQVTTVAGAAALRFDDHKLIFEGTSTKNLIKSLVVFRLCGISAFVNNAETLLWLSKKVIGERFTNAVIRHTFFSHFCAGEDAKEVWTTMAGLRKRGVGAILDYAAEDDAPSTPPSPKIIEPVHEVDPGIETLMQRVVGRMYDYQSEMLCDKHVDTFLHCVDTAGTLPGQGFAAIKVTALGNPLLLKRVSVAIRSIRGMFQKFDKDGSGFIDKEEFDSAWQDLLIDSTPEERAFLFSILDSDVNGRIDYIEWCQQLKVEHMPRLAERIHRIRLTGHSRPELVDLHDVCLDDEEVKLVAAMQNRLHTIAYRAVEKGVKLMIDAEHTYFQPAIDHLTLQLMKEHNKDHPTIYNTYQAYLTDSLPRLLNDIERAAREGYTFGCKLVRGAYLHLERNRAKELGYTSPVWDTIEETHKNYADCVEAVLVRVASGKTEILLASHNEQSIEQAVKRMAELGIDPKDHQVTFGQLLGMSDHLTITLGQNGYPAYKYVPYGAVSEVIPYLLRRASENASILSGTKADVKLLQAELRRRLLPF